MKKTRNEMPITVNIYYKVQNGGARSFVREIIKRGTAAEIRADGGNMKYEYFYSENDPETVLLIDAWRNQDALDRHHASPMMNTITSLREKYGLRMEVERYLSDDASITENDRKFIKE